MKLYSKFRKTTDTISETIYLLKILWKIDPARVVLSFAVSFLGFGEWVFFTVIFMKYLFGAAEIQRSFEETAVFIAITMLVLFFTTGIQIWFSERYIPVSNPRIYEKLNTMLFDKAANVEIACYEDAEFYDTYTKASSEAYTRALSVLTDTPAVFASALSSIYVVAAMYSISWLAGILCFMPMISSFVFGKIINRLEYERTMENIPQTRRINYINRVLYLQKYAKEFRMTGIYRVLEKTYEQAYQKMLLVYDKYAKRLFAASMGRTLFAFTIVFEGTWMFAAFSAMVTKTILIGDFVVVANAIVSTTWMLISFTDSLNLTYQNGLFAKNMKTFLNYKETLPEDQDGLPVPDKIETLELKNVSFQYPGQKKEGLYAVKNVNCVFHAGKKTALVGHNGSGKSTLIKLIMRFYDPTEGEILLNGTDIRKFCLRSYRALIGSTFQDFELFSMSVLENVMMEQIATDQQRQRGMDALLKSGALEDIEKLPKGADSVLTREFDPEGVILSGGQAQKVAVARSFAKDRPILLLDEPSSALDPVAEYQMYETIMELCDETYAGKLGEQAKIAVIISHRLSSAAMADRICLMQHGEMTEQGTHQELMELGGSYADMFLKQAESYLQDITLQAGNLQKEGREP